ncbi:uncharacterized protein LOC142354253 [Convolutriloba macropyga]|uniref:uncharacterized protein LOC142354253 n=1 Tax=Convolutriloba macropyga TaxID=536237 RepID=UPI003F51BFAE
MGEWASGLCSCFGDIKVCILTIILPCYVHGKTAEAVGASCPLHCVLTLIPLVNLIAIATMRSKVRSNRSIEGGCVGDVIATVCCTSCAICQHAREMNSLQMARE